MQPAAAPAASTPATPKLSGSQLLAHKTEQTFLYLLVLDFEATCDENKGFGPQEIIEFPTVVINACTLQKEAEFHSYVRPVRNPKLTPFCTQLTGIRQDQVDPAPTFPEVWQKYLEWLKNLGLLAPDAPAFAFVTCGDWDLKTMLPLQLQLSHLEAPAVFSRWTNIKKTYEKTTGHGGTGMAGMLRGLRIPLVGRHHSGIDDSRNIAQILVALIKNGSARVEYTWSESTAPGGGRAPRKR